MRAATITRRPWVLALLTGICAAGAAGLVSAHNGDSNAIHGCVNQATTPRGQVVIYSAPGLPGSNPSAMCGTQGMAVDWGTTGGAGATGPSGPQGASGAAVATGASGPSGASGGAGPSGVIGPSGIAGSTGANGPSGPSGTSGPSGPSG